MRNAVFILLTVSALARADHSSSGMPTSHPFTPSSNQSSDTIEPPTFIDCTPFVRLLPDRCERGGGKWKMMGNGCGDRCDTFGMMCTMALETGCDCGPLKCWDGSRCVSGASAMDIEDPFTKKPSIEDKAGTVIIRINGDFDDAYDLVEEAGGDLSELDDSTDEYLVKVLYGSERRFCWRLEKLDPDGDLVSSCSSTREGDLISSSHL